MGKCRRARRDGPGPWQPLHIPQISHLSSWGENLKLSFSPKEKMAFQSALVWGACTEIGHPPMWPRDCWPEHSAPSSLRGRLSKVAFCPHQLM